MPLDRLDEEDAIAHDFLGDFNEEEVVVQSSSLDGGGGS